MSSTRAMLPGDALSTIRAEVLETQRAAPTRTATPIVTRPPTITPTITPIPPPTATPLPEELGPLPGVRALPDGAVQRLGIGWNRATELSPDGRLVAVGTTAGIAVLDAETLEQQWFTMTPAVVEGIVWSPDGSGLAVWLVRGSTLYVLNSETGMLLRATKHNNRIHDAAWSPNGSYVAVATGDYVSESSVDLVDSKGQIAHSYYATGAVPAVGSFGSVAWSPGGTMIAAGGDNHTVAVWKVDTGEPIILSQEEQGYGEVMAVLSFNPKGTMLAGGTAISGGDAPRRDHRVFVWDLVTGEIRILEEHTEGLGVNSFAWSPDGTRLASGAGYPHPDWGGEIVIWDSSQWRSVRAIRNLEAVSDVEWSADGATLLSVGGYYDEGTIRLWNAQSWETILQTHTEEQVEDSFWVDRGELFGTQMRSSITLWSREGDRVEVVRTRETLHGKVWTDAGTLVTPQLPTDIEQASVLAWTRDQSRLAIGTSAGEIVTYNGDNLVELNRWRAHDYRMLVLEWSPDASRILSADAYSENDVTIWNASSGSRIATISASSISDIDWSPDGTRIVVGTSSYWEGTVGIYDVSTGELTTALADLDGGVTAVAWSADGAHISAGSNGFLRDEEEPYIRLGNTLGVWDALSGELLYLLQGHLQAVLDVAWSPDGSMLASTGGIIPGHMSPLVEGWSENRNIIWDAGTGALITSFVGHLGAVGGGIWSPDGSRFATESEDGTVLIWEVP